MLVSTYMDGCWQIDSLVYCREALLPPDLPLMICPTTALNIEYML